MASTTITVSTTQELYSALAKCTGGETILLEGGDYGALTLSQYTKPAVNTDFPSTVTIASADPADPAVFSQVGVAGMSNLTFDGISFDYTFKPTDPSWHTPFNFTNCENLAIRNSTFDGDTAFGLSAADNGYAYATGLQVRGSQGVVLEGNEFYDFALGLTVFDSADVVVQGNELHSMRRDGMNFSEVEGVLVEGNYIHDFAGSPNSVDHCDMIQFWTSGTDEPTSDVVIRNNVLDIGSGTPSHSIFMRNEVVDTGKASFESMAYRNVLIENNTITNAHKWGINVGEAIGLTIKQNTVVHADGGNVDGADPSVEIPLINVAPRSTGVAVTGNVTSALTGWASQPGWTVRNNAFVQDQDPRAPGYYADVFLGSSLQPGKDGSHRFVALPDAMIDKLGAGSDSIHSSGEGFQVGFHVEEADAATRVFDATSCGLNGARLPAGTTYLWDFGDGTTAKGREVSHSYAGGGDYQVTLTVVLPNGAKATQSLGVDVQSPEILSMDGSGRFTAYEDGEPIALGGVAKTATAEGLQLGAAGTSATVARAHVADVVGADDMTIAFTLDADKAGSSGELFRLHGSFVASVTKAGELQVQIMRDGAPAITCVTKGAGLNAAVNDERDVVISLDDGQLQLWVDGKLGGQVAVPGVVGGATGFGSHGLVFGNPWGQPNFSGDISDFEIAVGAGDYPPKPTTTVLTASLEQELDAAPAPGLPGHDLPSAPPGDDGDHGLGRAELLHLLRSEHLRDALPDGIHDRFLQLLQDRFDNHLA